MKNYHNYDKTQPTKEEARNEKIRPISDLRNNFAEVSREVHEHNEPVFFTKNGCGDMVVMSMEAHENLQFESEIYYKLLEAE